MLLAVFIPIANMSGVTERFFTSFGLTLAASIIISYVVVITFIQMLSSRIADSSSNYKEFKGFWQRFYLWSEKYKILESFYVQTLKWVLKHKTIVIGVIVGVFVLSLFFVCN